MATVFKGLLTPIWQPQKTSIRLKSKINIQKPRPPHFTRAKVEQLCIPKLPRQIDPSKPLFELCSGPGYQKKEIVNPYEVLLAKEALNWFREHKYIFFFHENSMRYSDYQEMRLVLKKCGVNIRSYGKATLKHTLIGSIYEPVLTLFQSQTLIGFGNDVNLTSLFNELRKTKIVLIAGIIDNRLLSVSELQRYKNLPDIQTLRVMLLSTLNSLAGNIVQNLNYHPQTLSQHLEQYQKLSKEDGK